MMRRVFALLLAACALLACSRPATYEKFVRVDQSDNGLYRFEIEFRDTVHTFDISFFSAIPGKPGGLPVHVCWTSPSGRTLNETVYMKAGDPHGTQQVYRSGVAVSEKGVWQLDLRPLADLAGFPGIGVVCSQTE